MCLGSDDSYRVLALLRFMSDMFEASLFSGLVYFLTFGTDQKNVPFDVALVLASGSLGGAFGDAIVYGVDKMNGISDMERWCWLFMLEGVPSLGLAFYALIFFLD
ncbi:hypothetical protein VKT23_014342 [Stygiomarasmius scandens]|uniref:Uncharacterized protein n=1 Tax=Marasmiellus scandens TaxID=2682957 RepID=A0ABR1J533_9AGAR